jgi:phosphoadenosine phosphosulfate reductase
MSLKNNTLFGLEDKVKIAIERIKYNIPKGKQVYVAFSGGKDSICIKKLAEMSKVKHICYYSATTIDYPDVVITGIRWEESVRRSKRRMVEHCIKHNDKLIINPIIDWTEKEVWEFIKKYKLPYPKIYDEGFNRIGCFLCPMSKYENKLREIKRYPLMAKTFEIFFKKLAVILGRKEQDLFSDYVQGISSKTNTDTLFE